MYSLSSTSSMLERVRRSIDAAKYHPSATDGISRCCQVPLPAAGSQRSHTAKMLIITRPMKKLGTDSPNMATSLLALSQTVSTLTAATIPSGIPSTSDNSSATAARSSEFGSRSK